MRLHSIETMQAAGKLAMPEGVSIHVNEVMDGSPQAGFVHIIVTTQVYAQTYIDPQMLMAADHPATVFANHVEMNVLALREELQKVLEAIDERT